MGAGEIVFFGLDGTGTGVGVVGPGSTISGRGVVLGVVGVGRGTVGELGRGSGRGAGFGGAVRRVGDGQPGGQGTSSGSVPGFGTGTGHGRRVGGAVGRFGCVPGRRRTGGGLLGVRRGRGTRFGMIFGTMRRRI